METTNNSARSDRHSKDLSIVNPTPLRCDGPALLHQLVRPASELPALEFLDNGTRKTWSYQELHEEADALAEQISISRHHHGSPDAQFVVPVLIQQSPELYIGLLAILKAGGAFCPLNIDAPSERIRFICEDVNAMLCLVSQELAQNIPGELGLDIVQIERRGKNDVDPLVYHRIPHRDDLAYVMYTSGSTGTPKGVGLSHDAVSQSLLSHDRHIPSFSRFLQFAAPTFDVSVFEIFFPLFRGSTLICARREEMLNDLPSLLQTMKVDACELTPTVAGSLLRKRENAPGLRLLLTIGEMLSQPVVHEFGAAEGRDSILWAMYGPTEATIHCTLQPAFDSVNSVHTIGIPLDTVSCFIIEPASSASSASAFTILPRGEIGELAVGGHQLATEYLNRPEQTVSSFIQSPFGRVYRTGDKARLREDGVLECLGRLSDGQVKLRGQRLELGEVESVILRTAGCHSALAMVIGSTLVAFCAVDSGISETNVMTECKRWLPRFMIPGELILMPDLTRLPSGKVDKKRMKEDYLSNCEVDSSLEHGATDEDEISRLTSQILGVRLQEDTRLSSAGLDSLRAIQLASLLRQAGFQARAIQLLTFRDLSEMQSRLQPLPITTDEVANLSHLRDLADLARQNPTLESMASMVEDILPCTPIQEAMLAETARNSLLYNNEVELEATSGISIEEASSAFRSLIHRNEILRTGFIPSANGFLSVIFADPVVDQVGILDDQPWRLKDVLEDPRPPFQVRIHHIEGKDNLQIHVRLHHACYDGWSLDMMLSDISDILQGAELGDRQQYRVVSQFYGREDQSGAATSKAFWGAHLNGWASPSFPALSDRPINSNDIKTVREPCHVSLDRVLSLSQRHDCAPQVIFQAALALTWAGLIGSSDVVIGTVTSGRSLPVPGIEGLFGPCMATIPLRVRVEPDARIPDLLRSIHAHNRHALEHSTISPVEMKRIAGLQSTDTLFDLVFVFQESLDRRERRNEDKLVREVRHLDRLEAKILVEVDVSNGQVAVQVTYHSASVPGAMAKLIVDQLSAILRTGLDAKDDTALIWQTPNGPRLSIFNAETETEKDVIDVATSFEAIAVTSPLKDAITIMSSSSDGTPRFTSISYQHLNEQSNRIARFLLDSGIQTGQVIAVAMEKSIELYAAILAIMKAGCGYLPLLPSTPAARARQIFDQGKIGHCVIGSGFSGFGSDDILHYLDTTADSLDHIDKSNLDVSRDLSRLAYVIYTSGTTGVPKGVAVTQRNLASNLAVLKDIYPRAGRQGKLLQACSQAFDVSVFEIFFAWTTGMCLCTGTNDVLFEDLEQSIRTFEITHLSLTPTVASLINPNNVPSVEFLVTAGEAMTRSVLDSWGSRLWQGYGPSETTNICSVKRMSLDDHINHLGWVFPNTSVLVLAIDRLDVLPIGWVGEFCFGGDQVAAGYHHMPGLTAEKFINHPVYGRIYRSGDMGRMLPDGSLLILGRVDTQIKLRGQRIEAGEVNSIVTAQTGASAVTLLARLDDGDDQLVSFYAPKSGQTPARGPASSDAQKSIFTALQSRLPGYMVPSYLVPIQSIPLTPSGKTDDWNLREFFKGLSKDDLLGMSNQTEQADESLSWTSMELSIRAVISQNRTVPPEDIRPWTPFPTLGIDSISAIRFSGDLSKQLGTRVPISQVLQNPSVAQLARSLDESSAAESDVPTTESPSFPNSLWSQVREALGKKPDEVSSVLPCTPLQQAMLSRAEGSYYNKILLRLRVSADDMKAYWRQMCQRHTILRTCFVTTSDNLYPIVQVALANSTFRWRELEVSRRSMDDAVLDHLQGLPEPLNSGVPPISFAIINHGSSEFLSLVCHHALYDGVAMEILWREVEALANGRTLAPPISLEPFVWETMALPKQTDTFWSDHFNGFRPSFIFSGPKSKRPEQCTRTTSLNIPLTALQRNLQSLNVSMLALFQAAWTSTLALAGKIEDVCFGNVMSGRTLGLEGLDRLVAPCFNTVPIRSNLAKASQNIELMKYFQQLNATLLRYQFTPLRRVQKIVNPQGRGLFDTLLILQQPLKEMDETIWHLEEDSGDMDIPLVCEVVPCPDLNSVVIDLHHDKSSISGATASAILRLVKYIIERLVYSHLSSPLKWEQLPWELKEAVRDLNATEDKIEDSILPTIDHESWSQVETDVRQVVSRLSHVATHKIRLDTTIFRLGLDSINAVQVASLLRERGHQVTASDVMELTTCAGIASRIAKNVSNDAGKSQLYDLEGFARDVAPQLQNIDEIEAVLPCTPMQNGMMASFVQSGYQNYLNVMSFKLKGVGCQTLLQGWKTLQGLHPMLRTSVVAVKHRDSSFAMVRRLFNAFDLPVSQHNSNVDLASRVRQLAQGLEAGTKLPWEVLLVEDGGEPMMHILMHHVLYDAKSLDGLLGALAQLVSNSPIKEFPALDHGLALMMHRSLGDQEASERFWTKMASRVVINSFPIMTPLKEFKRQILTHEITSRLSLQYLDQMTREMDYSVQAVIQAAWARVLSSYLGESTVTFGVTLSQRTEDDLLDIPLPCLTTVPVIATNQPSNRQVVDEMMHFNASLYQHQATPLSQIQKWLGHPASPVFDTLLAYQRAEPHDGRTRPWDIVEDKAVIDYPVSLEILPTEGGMLQLRMTHFNDVLPREQAALMVRQVDAILAHLLEHPEANENDLYARDPEIFSVEPALAPELPAPVTLLHQFVEEQATNNPEHPALECVSGFSGNVPLKRSWTYQQLNLLGDKVAATLAEKTKVGDIVAIHFDKCPEAYFSVLGILKAGCSFVALDPSAPRARKEYILQDSRASCVLCKDPSDVDSSSSTTVITISEADLLQQNITPEGREFGPDAICYCLYTSGTTGNPKGCEITHENAVQAMMAFQELFRGHWDNDSRWLQFAALHFDVSVLEQYWSWSVGITVVAAPKDVILDDLVRSIKVLDITHIDLTPSLARLTHPDEVPSLCRGVFITGGESLKQEILDVWGPKAVIYNAYGPTEATIGVTMYQRVPANGRPANIGRQFPNVGSYVFRPNSKIPVLRGGVGELCVSGKLVGKGYLHRPELTAEKFLFLEDSGDRIYRTGDLVRILHDGCFDFLGRADDQVKLRGQRLEIGEINHAIRTGTSKISDVATIVAQHSSSGKDVLVSFLVGEQSPDKTLQVIRDDQELRSQAKKACQDRLPGYMVPTYFVRLTHIPLSTNNKAEVKQLKTLFGGLSQEQLGQLTSSAPAIPASGKMTALIEILSDFSTVPVEDITGSTSIFDLGVDSISALSLVSLIKERLGGSMSPGLLLKHPIVANLLEALSTAQPESTESGEVKQIIRACQHRHQAFVCRELGVLSRDIEYIAPCSPLQEGILSSAFAREEEGLYFNTFDFDLDPDLSAQRLQTAWGDLTKTEAILRTSFISTPNGFVQVALKSVVLPWDILRVSTDDILQETLKAKYAAWVQENASHIIRPFEITVVIGPSFRRLIIRMFHASYDGISFDLMMDRIASLYAGTEPQRGPDFLKALASGPFQRFGTSKSFWETHLKRWMPSILLPPQQASEQTVTTNSAISIARLQQIRKSHNTTLQSVVLALWVGTLQSIMGIASTGIVVSGRSIDLANADQVIGPLFNTLPFLHRPAGKTTWAHLIRHCHDFITTTMSFQHVPLQDIQKWCSNGKALFDNLFTFQVEQPTSSMWRLRDTAPNLQYNIALEATKSLDGHLRLFLVAKYAMLNESQLEDLMAAFISAVDEASQGSEAILHTTSPIEDKPSGGQDTPSDSSESSDVGFAWTEQATIIRSEIAELLNICSEKVLPDTSVLELGLDSIDVIKLSTRLKSRNIDIAASQIMRSRTLRGIMKDQSTSTGVILDKPAPDDSMARLHGQLLPFAEARLDNHDAIETILPPTPLQESMVAGMLQSDCQWYLNHDIQEVSPKVDVKQLEAAWMQIIERSPILRTSFLEIDDPEIDFAYCQVVWKDSQTTISHHRLANVAEFSALIDDASARTRHGNGLSGLLQLRFATIGLQNYVLVSISHALYDGWSLALMYEDLRKAYYGMLPNRPSASAFLCTVARSTSRIDAQAFWSDYLGDVKPTLLSKPGSSTYSTDAASRSMEMVSKIPSSKAVDYCKIAGISLQVLCQACLAVVLASQTRSLDVTFGLILAGRDFAEADEVMFPTMNTVALRCILHGTKMEFLKYLEDNMAEVRLHQTYPLRKIQSSAGMSGPLFDVLFTLQKSLGRSPPNPLFESKGGSAVVEYPVCIEAELVKDDLVWRVTCLQLDSIPSPEDLASHLECVLEAMVDQQALDLISYQGQTVRLCGLPSITLAEENESVPPHDDSEAISWDQVSRDISLVLSSVSGVPVDNISISASVYDLGLDSISAIKVSSLLRKQGIALRPRDLLTSTSIYQMAQLVADQTFEAQSPETGDDTSLWHPSADFDLDDILQDARVQPEDVELILPATSMQIYMVSAWQSSGGAVFFPEFHFRVRGKVAADQVRQAWRHLCEKAPMFRTQVILTGKREFPMIQVVLKEHTTRPNPLVNFTVEEDEIGLLVRLRLHHALYDGISLPAFADRLASLIQDASVSKDNGLVAWKDHAIRPALAASRAARKDFWTRYLGSHVAADARRLDAPVHRSTRVSHLERSAVSASKTSRLRANAARERVGLQSVFLAAYATALARQNQSTDVVFGVYLASRGVTDLLDLYPTLELLPLRVSVPPARDIHDVARAIQEDIDDIDMGGVRTGLWEIHQWTGVTVDSFVNFLSTEDAKRDAGAGLVELVPEDSARRSIPVGEETLLGRRENPVAGAYPLSVDIEASVNDGAMDIGVFASRQRISEEDAQILVADVVACLEDAAR